MAWIGIECLIEPHELEKWGRHLITIGGGGVGSSVGEFLCKCGSVLSGAYAAGIGFDDRLLEIESRAAASIEQKRVSSIGAATRIVSEIIREDDLRVGVEKVMSAAGVKDWTGGRAAGVANGGVAKSRASGKRRRRKYESGGVVRSGADGSVVSTVEQRSESMDNMTNSPSSDVAPARGGCAGVRNTLIADKSYALRFESWAGVELRKMGFKMSHVARALSLDTSTAWRHISGYSRYWKRQLAAGVSPPEVPAEWRERLKHCVVIATGQDMPGSAAVVLNGTGDLGVEPYGDDGDDVNNGGKDVNNGSKVL